MEVTDDRTGKLISLPHPVKELRVFWPTKMVLCFLMSFCLFEVGKKCVLKKHVCVKKFG